MVLSHINEFCSFPDSFKSTLDDSFRTSYKCYDSTVGRFTRVNIQDLSLYLPDCSSHCIDYLSSTSFTEIGHALYNPFHTIHIDFT